MFLYKIYKVQKQFPAINQEKMPLLRCYSFVPFKKMLVLIWIFSTKNANFHNNFPCPNLLAFSKYKYTVTVLNPFTTIVLSIFLCKQKNENKFECNDYRRFGTLFNVVELPRFPVTLPVMLPVDNFPDDGGHCIDVDL